MLINVKPIINKPPVGNVQLNPNHPLATNLIGCWLLNEGGGLKVYNLAPAPMTGTITTAKWVVSGPKETGLLFGGAAGDDINLKNALSSMNNMTRFSLTIWATRTGLGGNSLGRLMDKRNANVDGAFFWNVGANLNFDADRWGTTNGAFTIPLPTANVLHHMVVTYDYGSTTNVPSMYVDGVAQSVTTGTTPAGSLVNETEDFHIGNRGDGLRNWAGTIYMAQVYNRILSAPEVLWLFSEPYAFLQPIPAIRYWSTPPVVAAAALAISAPIYRVRMRQY